MKPMVTAPARKSIMSFRFGDEAVEKKQQPEQRGGEAIGPQVDLREDLQIEEQQQVVQGQAHEAQRAPQEQPAAAPRVGTKQQHHACAARQRRKQVKKELERFHRLSLPQLEGTRKGMDL